MAGAPPPLDRKSVLTVIFVALLLDLLSFTLILPLFPRLLDHYRTLEESYTSPTVLTSILSHLNRFKSSFSKPISSRFDVVLLGGALGSLFSLLQAAASPIIGSLSDRYGRRTALLCSMAGNILSVALWIMATDFPTFLASRVVGGLSEGNVQLSMAIATDISSPTERGATLALVGVCFSIAFTLGPMIGAWLATQTLSLRNPFAATASFSLALLIVETIFLFFRLPETKPVAENATLNNSSPSSKDPKSRSKEKSNDADLSTLNTLHHLFLLIFSGMEFSLTFMTFDLFNYSSLKNGRLLAFVGVLASILQGSFTRRASPTLVVKTGLIACMFAFALLSTVRTEAMLYVAASLLAVTSATVVTGLTALASLKAPEATRGQVLGTFRAHGQVGRALGPIVFCSLYWWAGRDLAYRLGGLGMAGICGLAAYGLR